MKGIYLDGMDLFLYYFVNHILVGVLCRMDIAYQIVCNWMLSERVLLF